jgi:predicted transglutaminase-like cysteine proteinase
VAQPMPTQTSRPAGEMTLTQLTDGTIRNQQYILDELSALQEADLTAKQRQALDRVVSLTNQVIELNRNVGEYGQAQSWGASSFNTFGTIGQGGNTGGAGGARHG